MQITINLPPDLEQTLLRQAAQSNVSLQTVILQALRQLTPIPQSATSQWSDVILSDDGIPDFSPFEFDRDELLAPPDPELF